MSDRHSYGLLKGKKGIVFGPLDETSLGWSIAQAAYREGARLAISNVAVALRVGKVRELAQSCGDAPIIVADASSSEELEAGFKQLKQELGQVDFVVHSVGMSPNIRKNLGYQELNYDWYHKTLDISALSLHRIVTAALATDALADGGSIVALSYIAAQRNFSEYRDMGDAKALLESIVRNYGALLASRGIRINTVSQSPTRTRAGTGIDNFELMYEYADAVSPLGNATAEDCGDFVVTLLSDLTRKLTMQNLYHDGGFSSVGITLPVLRLLHAAIHDEEIAAKVAAAAGVGEDLRG